ncbi:hypothetical protein LTR78_010016 [Recurvomyces mirabilis]|uniref:Transglycosylase SLT domain-containing protein n=1 Tax=Recurvomyces mirabilis TaxID=574656 RepID=A0AAE0TQE1_9PEZI|nr:hypothetical protein LTR78_010016 [Recurvomyces mirabilis]KAK5149797.1 hypothetical protein LTS14_010618 [Recurvomyces mirabilis]
MAAPQRYYSSSYSPLVGNTAAFYSSNQELDQYDDHAQKAYGMPSKYSQDDDRSTYDNHNAPLTYDNLNTLKGPRPQRPKAGWSKKRKYVVFGIIAVVAVIILAVVIGIVVALTHKSTPYNYIPLTDQVTNETSFNFGATKNDPSNVNDGVGAGQDAYTYYSGTADQFPNPDKWISFQDLWNGNLYAMKHACKNLKVGKDNSDKDNEYIYAAIQDRAAASLVDHRFILAIILQESHGCVRVGETTSSTGITNPGLMQSHNGKVYSETHANASIWQMVQDGTQGTNQSAGYGLVQNLDLYGNAYSAARGYNSGYLPTSGNLSEAAGATACYVSDVANRLTGWANATSKCSSSGS